MDYDKIVAHLGDFGRYQKFLYLLICLAVIFDGMFTVMPAIVLATPKHRCKIPDYANDTYEIQNDIHLKLVTNCIPPSRYDSRDYDQCHLYTFNWTSVTFDNSSRPINGIKTECTEWVYSRDVFTETFTSRHNLVCGDSYKTSLAKSLYFVGVFVGGFAFGNISDAYGRKTGFYIAVVCLLLCTVSLGWSPSYSFFAVCNALVGLSTEGIYITGYVLGVELVGPSKRSYTGTVTCYFFALGFVIVSGIAYFVRQWRHIVIICAAPAVLILLYWWLLQESPRWLISKQRYGEADAILRKIAKFNNVALNDCQPGLSKTDPVLTNSKATEGRIWQLFTSRVLLFRTFVIICNWCALGMVYYGLSLNAGNLGGNFYLNFCLSGLVEFPAYTFVILLLDRLGRKWLHSVCMILGGSACLSTIFTILYLDDKYLPVTVALALLGKLGIAAAFAIIFIYSAELFPTVVRNSAIGLCSCFARFGAMAAPYIADLGDRIGGKHGKAMPLLVFGILSVLTGMLSLCLPETLGQELPETIEDAILYGTPSYKQKAQLFPGNGIRSSPITNRTTQSKDHIP